MKITKNLIDILVDKNLSIIKEEITYKEFFKNMLKKYGVNSPNELKGDKKKKFFSDVKSEWKNK